MPSVPTTLSQLLRHLVEEGPGNLPSDAPGNPASLAFTDPWDEIESTRLAR